MDTTTRGFLLTRAWRDTPQGIELTLWATTDDGPLRLVIDGQEAVCFVDRDTPVALPPDARRRELPLARLGGGPVDGLYFRQRRDLQAIRGGAVSLCESDVRPAERFLMERFIRAGFEASGEHTRDEEGALMRNPVLRPAAFEPVMKVVSLDIETRGGTNQLYSIAGAVMAAPPTSSADASTAALDGVRDTEPSPHGAPDTLPDAVVFMVGEGEPEVRSGYTLHYARDERTVLRGFLAWLNRVDPDVLSGWSVVNFDIDFLERRARALNVPFLLGRGQVPATVLQPSGAGAPRVALVPGRAVLDGIDLMKATFRTFDSFSLDNVSHVLLGTGKLITSETNKLAEINRLFRDDKPGLADYNLRDCTLVNEILDHASLIAFAVRRASLTGLPIDRLGGAAAAFDNLYLPLLHRRGHVAPDIDRREATGGPGGHVMDSVPGLYRDVLVLDFKSLYPSIIRTFLIDPLGLSLGDGDDSAVPGFLGARFAREGHILPDLIDELWQARDAARQAGDAPLSQAIKIIMNSFYGVFGTTACRFYSERLVSSITRRGQEIITTTRAQVEAAGHRVIYGDTDSLFVQLEQTATAGDDADAESVRRSAKALVAELNAWWRAEIDRRFSLVSHLELEYETHYERFLMPTVRGMPTGSKKRYAGLVRTSDGTPELVVKGLEAARSDWTPLAREFQRELFRRVFLDLPWEDHVRETVERLRAGELDDALVYRRRLSKRSEDYRRSVPVHVQAARKLERPGRWIRYVITVDGPEPVEARVSPPDHEHYLERQLAPAADGVLRFLGTSFADITDAQLGLF